MGQCVPEKISKWVLNRDHAWESQKSSHTSKPSETNSHLEQN